MSRATEVRGGWDESQSECATSQTPFYVNAFVLRGFEVVGGGCCEGLLLDVDLTDSADGGGVEEARRCIRVGEDKDGRE